MVSKRRSPGFRSSVMALAMTALPFAFPAPSLAAGLGKLVVFSSLGEPLRADVELEASKDELASLSARIAPQAAFRKAGVDFASILQSVKVSVVTGDGGKSVLRLSTDRPVPDPFMDLLLEINWAAGRLVREYTFLLDPPDEAVARTPVAPLALGKAASSPVPPAPSAVSAAKSVAPPSQKLAKTEVPAKSAKVPSVAATHTVKSGETAAVIARDNLPEGVSLDQMLVAMVRGNPDAFDGGNVNRLRAGRILDLPDAATASAVNQSEAHKFIVAQASDFNAYRRRLAGQVAAAPAPEAEGARQGVSGKLSARVDEKAPAEAAKSGDQLKVSRTDQPRGGGAVGKLAGGAREEDLVAREKALKDANSRLGELERNVQELQKLLELKNQALADLQKQGGSKAPAAAAAPVAAAVPAAAPAPAAVPAAAPTPAAAPATTAPAATPTPVPPPPATPPQVPAKPPVKKHVLPPPPPAEPPGFFEDLLGSPISLAAGGGALAALLGFALYKRRQKSAGSEVEHSVGPLTITSASGTPSIFGTAGGRSVDTSASAIQTDFSQSGMSAIDTDEGVDPVAEADVYMAYGRDAQAEEILLDALKNDPDRNAIRLKLLEIYAQRKSMLQFETVAGELYARTGGSGVEWEKAATLGQMLDPHNPLYARGPREEAARPVADTAPPAYEPEPEASPLADTWARSGALNEAAMGQQEAETPFATSPTQSDEPVEELDFDLGLDFHGGGEAEPAAELAESEEQSFDSTAWMGMDEAPSESHEEHDHSFDSTVVLGAGGPRFGTDPFAGEDFHIDLGDQPGETDEASEDMDATAVRAGFVSSAPGQPVEQASLDLNEEDVHSLDFDLGDDVVDDLPTAGHPPAMDLSGISLDMEEDTGSALQAHATFAPEATVARDAFRPFGMEEPPEPAQEMVEPLGQEMDFTDMFSEPEPALLPEAESAPPEVAEPDVDPTAMEEAGTKLELAQAYEEMGDREGARDLLQEVLQEGSKAQKEKANAILARLA